MRLMVVKLVSLNSAVERHSYLQVCLKSHRYHPGEGRMGRYPRWSGTGWKSSSPGPVWGVASCQLCRRCRGRSGDACREECGGQHSPREV